MQRQSEPRAGNHQRHTHTRNALVVKMLHCTWRLCTLYVTSYAYPSAFVKEKDKVHCVGKGSAEAGASACESLFTRCKLHSLGTPPNRRARACERTAILTYCCYKETRWLGMHKQAGNHQRHTRIRNSNVGQQRCASRKQQLPNQAAVHASNQDTTLTPHPVPPRHLINTPRRAC